MLAQFHIEHYWYTNISTVFGKGRTPPRYFLWISPKGISRYA